MGTFNLDRVTLTADDEAPAGFGPADADVAGPIGARRLAGNVIEVAAGTRGWPYHWEAAQEEWLLVLDGPVMLRTPEGEQELVDGDLVCFPPGPEGAHQLRNATDRPVRVLMVSDDVKVNVVVYADTGKVGPRSPWVGGHFPPGAGVPYWEGEA